MNPTRTLSVLAALALGCSSIPDPNPDLGGPPGRFPEFTASTEEHLVSAQAYFEPNYEQLFRSDLLDEGVIPIHLEARAFGALAELGKVQLLNASWDPRLYLQDGTALRLLDIDSLKEIDREMAKRASGMRFSPGLLTSEKIEGFLFFKLEPEDEFRVRGRQITHRRGDSLRGVDLYHSLLAFNVSIDDESYPFYVGVKPQ